MATNSGTYRVPARFLEDHIERDLYRGDLAAIRWTRNGAIIPADADTIDELLDDAQHYAASGDFSPECRGLIISARATVKALKQQGV